MFRAMLTNVNIFEIAEISEKFNLFTPIYVNTKLLPSILTSMALH